MRAGIVLILITLMVVPSFAQDNPGDQYPIDIKMQHCLDTDSNQTTYGMCQCSAVAREEWEVEMNMYLQLLMDTLTEEEGEKLKQAQQQWTEYRDAEIAFKNQLYTDMMGTMWRVVAAGRAYEIMRERALGLKGYYEMLTLDR